MSIPVPASRLVCAAIIAATLAACASTPPPGHVASTPTAALRLCPGMGVSNPPPVDAGRYVINYAPITTVDGVALTRAPVNACISSGYGPRRGGAGGFHEGVDLYTRRPLPVYAGGDGVVEAVQSLRGYGRTILIRHTGRVQTRYAHLSAYASGLKPGAHVRRGSLIGYTGDSGNATAVHLHYEILLNGRPQNPMTIDR